MYRLDSAVIDHILLYVHASALRLAIYTYLMSMCIDLHTALTWYVH